MVDCAYLESRFRPAEIPHGYGPNVHLLDDPLAWTLLSRLSSPESGQPEVGRLVRALYRVLGHVAINAELAKARVDVPTRMSTQHPEGIYRGLALARTTKVVTVGIARAGTVPSQVLYDLLNDVLEPALVRQDHLFMSRATNEQGEVVGATWHDAKIGRDVEGRVVFFPDPMGATGSSMVSALDYYSSKLDGRPAKCVALHLIVTPEYVRKVLSAHPDVAIYALRLDRGFSSKEVLRQPPGTREDERGLNEIQYIVPGAGGVGEILNNAWV